MAVDLTSSRHSIGRIPEDQFRDLAVIADDRKARTQRHGLYFGRGPRVTPEKLILEPNGTPNHTLAGGLTSPKVQNPDASQKPQAEEDETIHAIGDQRQQQDTRTPHQELDGQEGEGDGPLSRSPKGSILESVEAADDDDDDEEESLSETESPYPPPRPSFATELLHLTKIELPQPSALAASISAIPTASAAAQALIDAFAQFQSWIQNASEIFGQLDAVDDIEWAAAAGRKGLEEVESVVSTFDGLNEVFLAATEELNLRDDITDVPPKQLETVVEEMELAVTNWKTVAQLIKAAKSQVELAMEWEELWNVVLGDIGAEMNALGRLVFEMEEKRHKVPALNTNDHTHDYDIEELETIVEETPVPGIDSANHRFSLPPAFPTKSAIQPTNPASAQDDSSLMALFARMQPLRASLDFLPMRLSAFHARADAHFPTACSELESRRAGLERQWKELEQDAESLRQELGEDRWVLVFRNAGRQAQKMCESVERSMEKLQEAIVAGAEYNNPTSLAKKVDNFEAKKIHYGPAIKRVLNIIEKGLNDRLTVNGEILRLHLDMNKKWSTLEATMKDVDAALEDLNLKKSQQLRDSLSSIMSLDRSAGGSAFDTPRSSPASSIVMGPTSGNKADPSTPGKKSGSRRSSFMSSTASRPGTGKRYFSVSQGSTGSSNIPRKSSTPLTPVSPSSLKNGSTTPTPNTRMQRPSPATTDGRPRWTSSGNMNGTIIGHNFKPLTLTTPSPHSRTTTPLPSLPSRSSRSSIPLPSPLARESSASPGSTPYSHTSSTLPRTRRTSSMQSPLALRDGRTFPSPKHINIDEMNIPGNPTSTNKTSYFPPTTRRQSASLLPTPSPATPGAAQLAQGSHPAAAAPAAPAAEAKPVRPSTALAGGRRSSMLPQPKARVGSSSGRTSAMGGNAGAGKGNGRNSSLGGGEERRWR